MNGRKLSQRGCGILLACGWVLATVATPLAAAPVSSAFTYQGELFDEGQPAVGSYDIRFTPYEDAVNPVLLGPPLVVEDVLVSAGVFTARVDFGPGFFVGDAVFLEIAMRPGDSSDPNAFETLSPRQEITAAPYALKPAPGSVSDIELAGDAVGTAASTTFQPTYRDPAAADAPSYLLVRPNGFASFNPASPSGGYIPPAYPLTVGISDNTANGNGATSTAMAPTAVRPAAISNRPSPRSMPARSSIA